MKLLVFAFINLSVYCAATNVQQCPDIGKSIDGLSNRITVGNCKKPPCRLRRDTAVDVGIKFKPEYDVESLVNSVNANIIGIPFPFVGVDGADACGNIYKDGKKVNCPLKAGEEYDYKVKIDVLRIYPKLKIVVHWGLLSPKGNVICFEVPARITD